MPFARQVTPDEGICDDKLLKVLTRVQFVKVIDEFLLREN
jgi:hypothetical protein